MSDWNDDVRKQRSLAGLASPPTPLPGHRAREEAAREAPIAEHDRGGQEATTLLVKAVRSWPLLLFLAAVALVFVFTGSIGLVLTAAAVGIVLWRVFNKRLG